MKKTGLSLIAILAMTLFAASVAMAECPKGQCPMEQHKNCSKASSGDCGEKEYCCPITAKFMKKADFFLDNADEIGLSEEQIASIKSMKSEVKKGYIRGMAEMQIFEMDVNAKMSEPTVDVEGLNALIDSTMGGMIQGSKTTVASYAKLKAVLTPEQMSKAKEIWKKKS